MLNRRTFLKAVGALTFSSVALVRTVRTPGLDEISCSQQSLDDCVPECRPPSDVKLLSCVSLNTGERLKNVPFWEAGQFVPDALAEINHHFRDHRNNKVHLIDPQLLVLLHALQGALNTMRSYELISGFRSPETNKMLRARSSGVAKDSQHLYGKAADICIRGYSMAELARAARALKGGGVGGYANFVHLDTGHIRRWGSV